MCLQLALLGQLTSGTIGTSQHRFCFWNWFYQHSGTSSYPRSTANKHINSHKVIKALVWMGPLFVLCAAPVFPPLTQTHQPLLGKGAWACNHLSCAVQQGVFVFWSVSSGHKMRWWHGNRFVRRSSDNCDTTDILGSPGHVQPNCATLGRSSSLN